MNFRFRDPAMVEKIVRKLEGMNLNCRFMHVCGTHQDTLIRFGLEELLSKVGVEIRQGPGCPVCVTTTDEINEVMALARSGITLALFGDMMRVPTPNGSLADLKSEGADVRVVYSIEDAVRLAENGKEVVFMAVGFETTAPTTAVPLLEGAPESFSIYSCHRSLTPALEALFEMGDLKLDGIIQPGHVATIIGVKPFRELAKKYSIPQVISGFEPLDLLMAVYLLAKQIKEGKADVINEYTRVVRPEGNTVAQQAIKEVFQPVDGRWRGFPVIPRSILELKRQFEDHNAKARYEDVVESIPTSSEENPGCRCGEVLRGLIDSRDCPAFGVACTPANPLGPCMVSMEGSCNIYFRYHRSD